MNTALKLKPIPEEPATLSEIPPLGKNRGNLKLVWENPKISHCMRREKPKVKLELVSGQTLFGYVLQNPVNFIDPFGLATITNLPDSNPGVTVHNDGSVSYVNGENWCITCDDGRQSEYDHYYDPDTNFLPGLREAQGNSEGQCPGETFENSQEPQPFVPF